MSATFTTTLASLPTRDQAAWRIMLAAVNAGGLAGDPQETLSRCYDFADEYLSIARQSWREANGKADADADEKKA